MSGRTLAVGSPGRTEAGRGSAGAVFVFESSLRGATDPYIVSRKITAPSPTTMARFGACVALEGSLLLVSSPGNATAHLFARDQGGPNQWGLVRTFSPSEGAAPSGARADFGVGCSLSGRMLAVVAPGEDVWFGGSLHVDRGAVHLFRTFSVDRSPNPQRYNPKTLQPRALLEGSLVCDAVAPCVVRSMLTLTGVPCWLGAETVMALAVW